MSAACRVLLIDDEEDACLVLGDLLEDTGCQVSAVSDPLDAVRIASVEAFDLVLLDMRMPGMSGLDVLRCIRDKGHREIVILSGYVDDSLEARARREGACDVMRKPVDLDRLFRRIETLRRPVAVG
ncbi:MAG: response regulator [Armatimonadetes bacterium]|nr:response regulator [Armatimonadota bacterium]